MTTPIRLELPTGFKFGTVNAYLFPKPEPALVDTGLKSADCWAALQNGLARHGLSIADIARVVITHPHVDHCGLARRITGHSRADIWIVQAGRPWLVDLPDRLQQRTAYYRSVYLPRWNLPAKTEQVLLAQLKAVTAACEAVTAGRIRVFQVGDTLTLGGEAWQVLPAAGHAPTQTCFYQPAARHLLAGDALLSLAPAPVLERPRPGKGAEAPALAQFLDTLRLLNGLDITTVYPGHGEPFENHRQVIRRQQERLEQRLEECRGLISAGQNTFAALMDRMYSLHPSRFHLTGLWMLAGYLELLAARGLIETQVEEGVEIYRCLSGC